MKQPNFKKKAIALAIALTTLSGAANSAELEVIEVTSQKRVENLQNIAVSVIALSGEDIANTGATDFETISDALPNVDISSAPGIKKISIRGLGSGTGNPAFEQSVGLYVDGVYASRVDLFQEPFLDIDRLEVLKGPQGVLLGKNSIAGALSINSVKPTNVLEGSISAGYEFENESYQTTGIINVPITDNLAGRLAVKYSSTGAYLDNGSIGNDATEAKATTIRGSLLWDASDDTQIYLKVETSDLDETGSPFQLEADRTPGSLPYIMDNTPPGSLGPAGGLAEAYYRGSIAGGEDYIMNGTSYTNEDTILDQQSESVTFQVTHNIGDHELVYLAGYAGFDKEALIDQDFSATDILTTDETRDYKQLSHELRIVSPKGETIDYIAGIYYLDREFNQLSNVYAFGPIEALRATSQANYNEESTSKSAFGQVTWNIADNFRASVGGRYSEEKKTGTKGELRSEFRSTDPITDPIKAATLAALFGPGTWEYTRSITEYSFDPSFNVQWNIDSDKMAYFSWTKASKAGGFDASEGLNQPENFIYKPEEAAGIEFGLKMDLLENSARLNITIFRTEFDDLQVSSWDPTTGVSGAFVTTNAGKAISQGIEVDALYAVTDSLTVGGNVAYLQSEYDEFFTGCATNAVEAAKLGCEIIDGVSQKNLSGYQTESAPKWTGSIFGEYFTTIGGMNAKTLVNAIYKSETVLDPSQDSHLIEDGYVKVNVNFTLSSEDDVWAVDLGVYNLTDEQPTTFGGQAPFVPGTYWKNLGRGREIKANVTYRFEE
ncbi:TonB-dependent receptor [Colwellia sp. 20A7]|uniref:TonB-dependent receptor n=1 Tax=Colwellia sp. 20A7 TaxID=2689569 RepID=UPI001357C7D5|nr:TonB-dependent receptor [Colwellia sp. 20A7]